MNDIIEKAKKNQMPLLLGAAMGLATGASVAPTFFEFPEPSKILCEKENATSCKVRYSCDVGWTNRGPC